MFYDTKTIGDLKKYFDTRLKRNYWVLGYFGGGSVNIVEAYKVAQQFAHDTGVPLESVRIDEILHSRRHKSFKFVFSNAENQIPEKDTHQLKNVYEWLTD